MGPVNLKTAALRLGVHYQTAYRWVRSGQLVAVKVGSGYEVSDAAVERLQAQRSAMERTPERAAEDPQRWADATSSRIDDALHVLDTMVDAVTLDASAVAGRAARVAAENLGDTAFLYRRAATEEMPDRLVVIAAAHRDPVSEVAANTLGRDPRTSTKLVRRAVASGETICVPQVPQRELRRRLHPELHEHLRVTGCFSALVAPVGRTAALLVTRDLPGRPYTNDDVAFVAAIAARVARADERVRCWTGAWELRRAMVDVFEAPTFDGSCFEALPASATATGIPPAEPVVAVLDLELRHVACSKPYAALLGEEATQLVGVSLRSLVRDGGALDEALAPVLLGEIDFRSVELDVVTDDARVALHVAMVRRQDATPRGVVVVAHSVPALSGG
jgi:excisionase family DNA binding protein